MFPQLVHLSPHFIFLSVRLISILRQIKRLRSNKQVPKEILLIIVICFLNTFASSKNFIRNYIQLCSLTVSFMSPSSTSLFLAALQCPYTYSHLFRQAISCLQKHKTVLRMSCISLKVPGVHTDAQ